MISQFFRSTHKNTLSLAKKSSWLGLSVISILTLTACGFELRTYSLSDSAIQADNSQFQMIESLNLECPTSQSWQLCQHLRQQLKLGKITLEPEAELTLSISSIKQSSRILSLQSNAAAAEYGLTSKVSYRLIHRPNQANVIRQDIELEHSYRHESSALLAKERERDELQTTLSQQLALEIFRQIRLFDRSTLDNTSSDKNTPSTAGK